MRPTPACMSDAQQVPFVCDLYLRTAAINGHSKADKTRFEIELTNELVYIPNNGMAAGDTGR